MKIKWFVFGLSILICLLLVQTFFTGQPLYKINIYMMNEEREEKLEGIFEGLTSLGYSEELFEIQVFNAEDNVKQLKDMLPTSLKNSPNLILTLGGIETIELKNFLEKQKLNIPVLFVGVAAPQEIGIVKEFKHPGGNITGLNNHQTVLSAKRLELLTSLIPTLEETIVIYDSTLQVSRIALEEVVVAAKQLNQLIKIHDISLDPNLKKLETYSGENIGVLILPAHSIENKVNAIAKIANKKNWMTMGMFESDIKNGFLFSYGTSFYDQGYQSARFISLIYQGNLISEIPVELPDNIELLINKDLSEKYEASMDKTIFPFATVVPSGGNE